MQQPVSIPTSIRSKTTKTKAEHTKATATKDVTQDKKVSQFFWRSWAIQASWNYERQMNMGFLYGMVPTLDRLYPDESDPKQLAAKKEAYHRHMAFYNCTPQTSAFILGLSASMEEEYAKDPENFDPDSINAVKTSLMGPLSGIGDSFFQGTIRVIAFGLGVQLAQQGSIMGPILAMLISIVPSVLITWFAAKMGYQGGHEYLSKLQGGDLMEKLMYVCGIVGLMSVGGMIATLIGATTRAGSLSAPLRDRFGVTLRLELYTPEELATIVKRSAGILNVEIEPEGAMEIARRSRGTPRIANRMLRRVRDFAQVVADGVITRQVADQALLALEVDHLGLDQVDRRMLRAIIENYGGGPVGLDTLAATIGEESVTLEDVYEPYLMQIGFLTRTPRGRCVTQLAYEHLHLPSPVQPAGTQLSF